MDGYGFDIIQTVALILGPGGAVYIGLKTALNGLRRDITDIKKCTDEIHDDVLVLKERTRNPGSN